MPIGPPQFARLDSRAATRYAPLPSPLLARLPAVPVLALLLAPSAAPLGMRTTEGFHQRHA